MPDATVTSTITVTIDGKQVAVPPGTTLYDAARSAGIDIPVLCHSPKTLVIDSGVFSTLPSR